MESTTVLPTKTTLQIFDLVMERLEALERRLSGDSIADTQPRKRPRSELTRITPVHPVTVTLVDAVLQELEGEPVAPPMETLVEMILQSLSQWERKKKNVV